MGDLQWSFFKNRLLFSQESYILDFRLGSKYVAIPFTQNIFCVLSNLMSRWRFANNTVYILYFAALCVSLLVSSLCYTSWVRFLNFPRYLHECDIRDKVFKNGPSKICGRQPSKNLNWYDLLRQTISLQIFERFSSTNFTSSILEYLDSFIIIKNMMTWMWFFSRIIHLLCTETLPKN